MKRKTSNAGTRPVHVKYYLSAKESPDNWHVQGHCKREEGVLRNAFVRVAFGQYQMARVYRDGINVFTIRRGDDGFPRASFGPHQLGQLRPDGTIKYTTV